MKTTSTTTRNLMLGATLLLVALAPAPGAFAASAYTITDLGENVTPNAINEAGQVAGESGSNAFLYSNGALNTFHFGNAKGLNNLGHVVGQSYVTGNPYLYDGSTVTYLAADIPNVGEGRGINDSGQIVGLIDFDFTTGYSQFLYDSASATMEIVPGLEVNGNTEVRTINNSGQLIVNAAFNDAEGNTTFVARRYDELTSFTDLPPFPGEPGTNGVTVYAINNQGHVTGVAPITINAEMGETALHTFLFDGANMLDLGFSNFGGQGINDLDHIVGGSLLFDGATVHDLNGLLAPGSGWVLTSAVDINNQGQIIGQGLFNGVEHGFLMTPVPVPAAVYLFGTGLVGLAGLARRRMNMGV